MHPPSTGPRTRFAFGDFLYYSAAGLVPLLTGAVAIYPRSALGLIGYGLVGLASGGVILYHFCTHCPHYLAEGRSLRCMFFWGLPKPFARRPGPLRPVEKLATFGASAAVIVFPLAWLADDPGLLATYLLSLTVFIATVWRHECRRCVHRHCPINPNSAGAASGADAPGA